MPRGQSDGSVVVDILLDGENAKKYWENFNDYMEMSTKQLEKRLMASTKRINDLQEAYGTISQELRNARKQKLEINFDESKVKALQRTEETLKRISQKRDEIWANRKKVAMYGTADDYRVEKEASDKILASLKEQYAQTSKTHAELKAQYRDYIDLTNYVNQLKDARKEAYNLVKQETAEFENLNQKYVQVKQNNEQNKTATKETANHTKQIANNTKAIKSHTSNIGANIKSGVAKLASGLKKVVSLSLALLGIRSLFTGITSALRTWMNSEDELAKKTKANLESLKLNFAQILQPALQWVINAFNNILALLGAVIRQFTKLNIFAKKTATSTGATSKNMQNTLASFDKIDVLQKNDGGGGGDGAVEPFDMESLMTKYEDLAKKIKEIFETIFDPVKKAWENKGEGVINSIKSSFESLKGLGEAVGGSIFEVWTNGTGQTTIETILDIFRNIFGIVGKIADAWKNAWNNDNNGTKIIQNVWDALNDVLGIIETITGVLEKVYQSEGYQQFANAIVKAGEVISQGIKLIADTFRDVVGEHGDEWGDKLSSIFGNLGKVIEVIAGAFEKLFGGQDFKDFYHDYIELLADAVDVLLDWWDVLSKLLVLIVDPNWENLKSLGESIGTFADDVNGTGFDLNEFMKKIPNWAMLLPGGGAIALGKLVGNMFDDTSLEVKIEDFKDKFSGLNDWWEDITIGFYDAWDELEESLPIIWDNIKTNASLWFENIGGTILGKIDENKKNINGKWNEIKGDIERVWNNIKENAGLWFKNIKETIEEKLDYTKSSIVNKWEDIKKKTSEKIGEIKGKIGEKWDEIKSVPAEKLEEAKTNVIQKWEKMKEDISNAIDRIKGAISQKWDEVKGAVVGKAIEIWEGFIGTFTLLKSTLSIIWAGFKEGLKTPLNAIIRMINRFIDNIERGIGKVVDKVNEVANNSMVQRFLGMIGKGGRNPLGSFKIDYRIPELAEGGIVTQATPAIIGEAGREAVLPLDQNTDWMDALAERIAGNQNFAINFTGSLSQLARVLKPEIDRENKRVGKSYIVGGVSY